METDLYFAIEDGVQQRPAGLSSSPGGPGLTDVIDFAMSIQQSRRSRRGQSLQNHFAAILQRRANPVHGSMRDRGWRDTRLRCPRLSRISRSGVSWPTRLRMVACKSTAKERWRQVLHEAVRIPEKYLLTVDPDLTPSTIEAMIRAGVLPFLPMPVIETNYIGQPSARSLANVADLLARLRQAAESMTNA